MFSFVEKNTSEISASKTLSVYGAFLFLTHVATWFWWNWTLPLAERLAEAADCWPFYESCARFRPALLPFVTPLQTLFLVASIIGAFLFLWPRTLKTAWWLLLLVTLLKLFFFFQDYRLMGNYHYIPHLVIACYLFLPGKQELIRWLLVAVYIAAGLLKFNTEWLDGRTFFREIWLPETLVPLASALAVILEMFVSFFLLSRRWWRFFPAIALFATFHLFSWHLVGFFYPVVMFCLLSIFVMPWIFENPKLEKTSELCRAYKTRIVVLLIFASAQILPYILPGDPALTSQGRMLALNMFDSFTKCDPLVIRKNGIEWLDASEKRADLGVRIHCDPIIYLGSAKRHCEEAPNTQVTMGLISKRSNEVQQTLVSLVENVCAAPPRFNIFRANDWIVSRPVETFVQSSR
jgi:hypothetical protein